MIRLALEGFGKDRGSGAIRKDCQKSVHKDEPTVSTLISTALGARLAETVHSILRTASKTYFWSDTMVVLSWIKKKEPWNTFVGNRVKEIRDLTNIDDWRHVPGEVNPADLATRCCDWSDLLKSKWWEVPGWLYSDEES
ncbi:dual 3',5'-cyclic-AMP and-GMP phosphodiesterase 11 [Trichonephila clavipes]|nr:dual 3',5'-cyclic-AMP and-GMP phosphodiesterase 11 [Trichonephila clavipes]